MLSKPLLRCVVLLATCLVAVVAAPIAYAGDDAAADADSREEASERFRRGVKLHKDRDYVAALVEFKRAYELAPNYRVLYNLGQTSRELKDYAAALVAYQQYLDEGGTEIPAARKKEVTSVLEELTERVGRLAIATNVKGAEIQVDDVVVGVSPLDEPIVVNIGKRRVVASLAGHAPAQRVIEVAGKDELTVKLVLADLARPEPSDPRPSSTPAPRPDSDGGTPVAGIAALSVTAACGIALGVLGGLALSARGDLDDALSTFPGNAQTIQDAQSRVTTFATATDVMVGVTAAGAVLTLVLFIVNPGSGEPEQSGEASGPHVSVAPSFDGVWLSGSF